MAQLKLSAADFLSVFGNAGSKVYAALRDAVGGYDYNSGWQASPTGGIFYHGLSTLPSFVQVQGSNSVDGSAYVTEHPTSVTTSQVVIGGARAYYRVLANR